MTHPIILITRPEEDAPETAALVRGLGFEAVFAPGLVIRDTENVLPDLSLYKSVIFSSAHGVRAFARRGGNAAGFSGNVYTVGDHTADAARSTGFANVISAGGTMRDLAALLKRDVIPPVRLCHLRGEHVRDDPAVLLPKSDGWKIDGVTLYRADPVEHLPHDVIELIRGKSIHGVLFYSARSAAAFVMAVKKDCDQADFGGVVALCIADTVIESVQGLNWREMRIAATPDQDGMMHLLESLTV